MRAKFGRNPTAGSKKVPFKFIIGLGWGGSDFLLGESRYRLYPHMRAKFGRDPTAGSKKLPFKFIIVLDGYPASLGFPIMHRVHVICIPMP